MCITWLLLFNNKGWRAKSGAIAASSGQYFQVNHFWIYRRVQNRKENTQKKKIKSVFKTIVFVRGASVQNIYDTQSTNIKMRKCQSCRYVSHVCVSVCGLRTAITTTGSKKDQRRKMQKLWHQTQTLKKRSKNRNKQTNMDPWRGFRGDLVIKALKPPTITQKSPVFV